MTSALHLAYPQSQLSCEVKALQCLVLGPLEISYPSDWKIGLTQGGDPLVDEDDGRQPRRRQLAQQWSGDVGWAVVDLSHETNPRVWPIGSPAHQIPRRSPVGRLHC